MNINQLMRALTEPDANMEKFLGGLAGNLVPGSSALRNYVNQDPYIREARGLIDNMMRGMPMYSETLPPVRDAFGEPVWRKRSLTTDNSQEDMVDEEMNRIILETGFGISPPASTENGVDFRDVKLADGRNAYDKFQELAADPTGGKGKTLKKAVGDLIQTEAYQLLSDGAGDVPGTKLNAIRKVVSQYRQAAKKKLFAQHPELVQQLMKRKVESAAALRKNREASETNPVQSLVNQLGL